MAAGFPSSLFLTLTGVTLLFALAETNGTLDRLAHRAVGLARGQARLLPVLLFVVAFALSSVGPGAIIAVALLIPMAMAGLDARRRAALPHRAGGGERRQRRQPVADQRHRHHRQHQDGRGRHRRPRDEGVDRQLRGAPAGDGGRPTSIARRLAARPRAAATTSADDAPRFETRHWLTIAVIGAWIAGVIAFQLNVGLAAFLAASLLVLMAIADETAAMKRVPWSVIVMVCGVTVLIGGAREDRRHGALHRDAGAPGDAGHAERHDRVRDRADLELEQHVRRRAAHLPADGAGPRRSSVGGGDPLAVALSINVGSAMVDVSPLSTLGALCVATVADPAEARTLFRQLLLWGLSMSVVGALLCQLLAGAMARA